MEQLRKNSGAVSKCSGALLSLQEQLLVFRSSYKSSGTVISLPEQLEVFRGSLKSVMDQLRKCSGAVTKVFRSS